MPWVKLDDQFTDHPKVVEAGPLAGWLYVCGLAYCARQLTDGFVPTGQLRRLLPTATVAKLAQRLVETRLWETVPGGFRVLSFREFKGTSEECERRRTARHQRKRAKRIQIAERDGWRCGICGEPITAADLHIDHIVPVCRGGRTEPGNLQATHRICNLRKGGR